ncbi:MAG TPA: type III-B CRISPR module RAMP protein Cmr4 [Bacteroidetes bacterium]|nr:type III-B CRISPR module RAMP protein Cmr4 [Bacteroidota bacterium]
MSQFETIRYVIMTVDPVHVGTGGMRLGRVDNSIVREPGTNLPKIPGTALHGAIRQYAAYRYGKPRCAGQGQSNGSKHCGQPTCPICYTFGFTKGDNNTEQAHSGVVSIGDARILFFPVYSMAGPVWITSPFVVKDAFPETDTPPIEKGQAAWNNITEQNHLNLGWLMVKKADQGWNPPDKLLNGLPEPVKNRIVLLSNELFSQVVNSNLEVRTSVSINPETGAAEEGALFTYEAIPRATFLWFNVVIDDYRREGFPNTSKKYDEKNEKDNAGDDLGVTWDTSSAVIESGMDWAEHLGIGGMGTRGFGRIRKIRVFSI